jgi:hypothetical protein
MDWRDEYKVHPAADVFPMLPDEELDELAADIKANELLEPVEYWGGPVQSLVDDDDGEIGEILDGRNRLEGCERAGEKPRFKAVYTDDPAAYVISKNIRRRHLTKQQQADLIVAAVRADADAKAAAELREHQEEIAAAELLDEDCVNRNRHGISRHVGEKCKTGRKADAVKAKAVTIAKEQGVSKRTVERSLAKAEGKTPEPRRYAAKPLPKPKSGKPVVGLEAARRHYLDLCADPGVDLGEEQSLIFDAFREIQGKRLARNGQADHGEVRR